MRKEKVSTVIENTNTLMNEVVRSTAMVMKDAHMVWKLDERLKERNMTQKELANITGLRVGTISEWVNGKMNSINKVHLLSIMAALRCTKMSDLVEIKLPDDLYLQFAKQRDDWMENREMPLQLKEMARENLIKINKLD